MEAISPPPILVLDACEIHLQDSKVVRGKETSKLSPKEKNLLLHLWKNRGEIVSREDLFTNVWGYSPNAVSRAVDATLLRLRKKIERDPSEPVHLFSLYGQGYRFVMPETTPTQVPKDLIHNLPKDLIHNLTDMPTPTPPTAPSRRFGTAGAKRIGGTITGEMLGRNEELQALLNLFEQDTPLITLTGPGGMGKTRMAQEVGRQILNTQNIEGGIWFVDLALATNANDILQTVADTLTIPLQESQDATRTSRRLGRAMTSRKRFLLILDNFEQLVEFAPVTVDIWRQVATEACFLITSRQALGLENETVFNLAPLEISDAIELFVERARAVKPNFILLKEQEDIVVDIVENLDRIPLAIRLAAGRCRLMSVIQIQKRLSDRFKLLRRGPGGQVGRQATMEAAIDWSWNLLTSTERAVLQQCAVFRSGFTLEAAEAVIQLGDHHDIFEIREILDSLASKSLLFSESLNTTGTRLNTYDSVRYYALERVAENDHFQTATERHTLYFSGLGEDLLSAMLTSQAHEAFRILKLEIDNFQAVFNALLNDNPTDCYQIYLACETLYSGLNWFQSSLEMADKLLTQESELSEEAILGLQSHRALAFHGLGRVNDARETLEWVRSKLDLKKHRSRWIRASVHDALLLARQGKYDEGGATLETLLKDPENQKPELRADLIAGLGFVRRGQQRFEETIQLWQEAIELGRGTLRHFWIEQTENNLAAMQVQTGHIEVGLQAFKTHLKRVRGLSYPQDVGLQLYNLAHVEMIQGDLQAAALHAQEATALVRTGVAPLYRSITCIQLAVIHLLNKHYDAAMTLLHEAKELAQSIEQLNWSAHAQSIQAVVMAHQGQVEAASTLWAQATPGILQLYPLTEHELKTLWTCHAAQAAGKDHDDTQALLITPGVRIPRFPEEFVADPDRRGNPDHHAHLLILEYIGRTLKSTR